MLTLIVLSLATAALAAEQTTRPATNPAPPPAPAPAPVRAGAFDHQPIVRSSGAGATTLPARAQQTPPESQTSQTQSLPQNPFEPRRVILALAAVIGLIVVLRFVARLLFPGVAAAGRASRAVRVLSRSPVSPKQQVMLVQVGRRVIVVGDCGAQMNPLAEISDPDEVAALVGQIESDKAPPAKPFGSLFRRARDTFEAPDEKPEDSEDSDDVNEAEAPADLGLAAAQGEIRGLMERVRGLAQQLKR
jgi:flagellar biogenesis protein FliO